ncbi:MAG: hypothetical protein R2708_29185 [Vicinamibacterales bacterium]
MTQAMVLFACVHNAGRSQMAAAWFNRLADPTRARALSAGTDPAAHVHPVVVAVMREVDLDLGAVTPARLSEAMAGRATHLVTMGCGEACPVVPGTIRDDWPFPDPKDRSTDEVRALREQIRARVEALIAANGWSKVQPTR